MFVFCVFVVCLCLFIVMVGVIFASCVVGFCVLCFDGWDCGVSLLKFILCSVVWCRCLGVFVVALGAWYSVKRRGK